MIPRDLIKQPWRHCSHSSSVHSSIPHPQSEPRPIFPFSTSHPPHPAVPTPAYAPYSSLLSVVTPCVYSHLQVWSWELRKTENTRHSLSGSGLSPQDDPFWCHPFS